MRIAVFGAGAVGTWAGAALAEAGEHVALIARGDHGRAMARDGVRLRSAGAAERVVTPALVTEDPAEVGGVDVVLVTVKAHDLPAAAARMGPLLDPETTIVAAQNGIPWWYFHALAGHDGAPRHVEAVDPGGVVSDRLDPARALGCSVYLGAEVVAPGIVETRPEAGFVLGEPDGSASPRLAAVAEALRAAGFPVRETDDIRRELWTKLMGNASLNLLGVLTRSGLRTMIEDPVVHATIAQVMADVVAIASALGSAPDQTVEQRLAVAARLGDFRSSTLQDLERGRRLELDALGAAVVELADAAGVAAPTLRMVYALADQQARSLGLR